MAKFNIEVELDWMDEEAYSIDDELRERIVKGVEDALLKKATDEAVKAVDNKIAEKILEAEETIQATVDQFIANVCEEKIGKIVIPQKKSSWSEEVTYKPLSEYVGDRFEAFLTERRYDHDGKVARYDSERRVRSNLRYGFGFGDCQSSAAGMCLYVKAESVTISSGCGVIYYEMAS